MPSVDERAVLQMSGLGEKRIKMLLHSGNHEIYDKLQCEFPKLKDCGGFELCRIGEGRTLQIIPCPKNGYTASYLCAVLHHAKVFIRPLQKDLDTSANENSTCIIEEVRISFVSFFLFHKAFLFPISFS